MGKRTPTKPKLLGDIKNPRLIFFKGFLFLLTGLIASFGLLLEYPQWRVAALLGIAIWSFARFYYFAFYVIEHYVDGQYKFAGLGSFVVYLSPGADRVLPRPAIK